MKRLLFATLFLLLLAGAAVAQQECTQPSCFQPRSTELSAIDAAGAAANTFSYYNTPTTALLTPLTPYGRSLLAATSSAALGLTLEIPRVTVATLPASPVANAVVVVTDALDGTSCLVAGGAANVTCQWTGSAWVVIGGSGSVAFTALTGSASDDQIPNLNVLSTGLTGNMCVTTDAKGLLAVAACVGGGTVTSVGLTAPAQFSVTGSPVTISGSLSLAWASQTQNFGLFGPTSGSGVPTFRAMVKADMPVSTVHRDQTNTYSGGDQNCALCLSFTLPTQTGAAPTANGRIAFDSTAAITSQSYKVGIGGATWAVALVNGNLGNFTGTFTGTATGYQPLDTDLTQLGVITGAINRAFIHNGTSWTFYTRPNCNGANDVLKYDNTTFTESCGTGAGGLSGGTVGTLAKYLSVGTPSTLGASLISESGATVTINATTLQQGADCTVNCLTYSGTYTGLRTRALKDASGTEAVMTGVFTAGNVVKTDAGGLLIDGGVAGTGTWTNTSTNTGDNKTLVAVGAGGTNTITLPLVASFEGGAITASGGCQDTVKVQINSGPQEYAILCATPASAQWGVKVPMLKVALGTFIVRIEVNDSVSSSHVYAGTVKAQCRASGTAPSSTWGSTQTISVTMTTLSISYQGASAAVTPDGTCSADSSLYVQFNASGSMTDTGTARLIGVRIYQAS